MPKSEEPARIWTLEIGDGPLVATAVHDGHEIREELRPHLALEPSGRLREEDPFTGLWTAVAPTRVIGTRSRFEVDLNRPRDRAIYRTPDDCWGLKVWGEPPPAAAFDRSLAQYDSFYRAMETLLAGISNPWVAQTRPHPSSGSRSTPEALRRPALALQPERCAVRS